MKSFSSKINSVHVSVVIGFSRKINISLSVQKLEERSS